MWQFYLETTSSLAKQLGQNIYERRIDLLLSQEELAERSGIAIHQLLHIERGIGNPTLRMMENIGNALDCSVHDLLQERETEKSQQHAHITMTSNT